MNNEERKRILNMVAAGNISPAEAEDLLSALEPPRGAESRSGAPSGNLSARPMPPMPPMPPLPPGLPRAPRRTLIIMIAEGGESKVNLRIPLALARAAGRFVPRHAQKFLDNYEINLDELLESLGTSEGDGTLLEIKDGDDKVIIAVE